MRVVNCYPGGPDDGWKLVVVKEGGERVLLPCTYDYFEGSDRIQCRTWRDRDARVKASRKPTFEADLSPARRFLVDNPDVEIARPRWVTLDTETDPTPGFAHKEDMRLIVICCEGYDGKEFTGVLSDWSEEAEAKLLIDLFAFLKNYDQIIGWNLGSNYGNLGFDAPVLRARTEKYWPGYSRKMNRWLWLDHLVAYKRLHLMFAETGEERSSYSLDAVSKFVLGEGKVEYDARNTLKDWQAGGASRAALVDYCRRDCALLARIEANTGILALAYEVARLCGCLNDSSGLNPTTFVDNFLLRMAGQRGIRLPTKPFEPPAQKKKIPGAFVFEPTGSGIQKDIISFDYSSLYPSIFRMLNASYETKGGDGSVSPMTGLTFASDREGIVPAMFRELGVMKKAAKDEYKKYPKGSPSYVAALQRHDAIKSVVNSGYGYIVSDYGRMKDKQIGSSVTLTGQYLIKKVAEAVEERGWRLVQGDTDSQYIHGASDDEARGFLKWCNEVYLPGIAKAHRCPGPPPVLEYDSKYERLIIASKKKYCGRYADSDEIVIKGLECRRGDASPLAIKLQKQVIDKLLRERSEDPEDFPALIVSARDHILHGELPREEIILSESIKKPLDEYEQISPAITAARIMAARGEEVLNVKVKYVVIDGAVSPMKAIPASDYTGDFDRHYTWQTCVYPPTQRLLAAAFPEYDWEQYAKTRPHKVRECAEKKYQAALEKRGQMRIPGT